jgi:release factor glutamine methyltransferase
MKIEKLLNNSIGSLEAAGIGTARLDALVLLEDVTGQERAWLLAHPEYEIPAAQLAKLEKLFKRRAGHEPLAYVRGHTEFYTRDFVITPAVLEPRPESETMIDCLKSLYKLCKKGPEWRIADVGTGSGALGITAALELPDCRVDLLEVDDQALEVAKINVDKFTLNIRVIKSDLLLGTDCNYNVLLCNLPYVPDDFQINQAAGREPKLAIFGGPDGLNVYKRLFNQIKKLKIKPLYILCESLPSQHNELLKVARKAGYSLKVADDFIQVLQRPY